MTERIGICHLLEPVEKKKWTTKLIKKKKNDASVWQINTREKNGKENEKKKKELQR